MVGTRGEVDPAAKLPIIAKRHSTFIALAPSSWQGSCLKRYKRLVDSLLLPNYSYFPPTAKLAMGSLAQNRSGAIRCSCNTRFRRVPEPSGADG